MDRSTRLAIGAAVEAAGTAPRPSRLPGFTSRIASLSATAILMVTRIWHGATPASKSDEYLNLMRTVAIPDYRSTPGNKGAYALRRMEGDTAHFLMVTFWESEEAIRAFARDDISGAKYYDFDKNFLLELEPCPTHFEIYDR